MGEGTQVTVQWGTDTYFLKILYEMKKDSKTGLQLFGLKKYISLLL